MKPVGITGSNGFYELLGNPRVSVHNNKYRRFSEIFEGMIQRRKTYFLPYRGEEHKVIVPRTSYRANIWVFKELGVGQILAANYIGSSNPDIELGSPVIPYDFCNWTRRFPHSLCDNEVEVYHVDTTPAYYPDLRKTLIQAANQMKPGHVHDQAVIFVNEGLRFEAPFELKMFRKLGADLIGITALSGAVFAREAAICYACICVPTNQCLGEQTEADDLPRLLKRGMEDFKQMLYLTILTLSDDRDRPCSHTLDHTILEE